MKPRVELVYFQGCPHVDAARTALSEALASAGMPPEWTEWDRDADTTPEELRKHGSPTVLVNGHDVVPAESDGHCCRVYPGPDGVQAAPPVESIRSALAAIGKKSEEDQC